jgi:hypothetical protein
VFIDAIMVKVRDGQVANRPIYAAIGVSLAGEKDVLGLWAGTGGERARFWMAVLTDLRNRGVNDVFFLGQGAHRGLVPVSGVHLVAHIFRQCDLGRGNRFRAVGDAGTPSALAQQEVVANAVDEQLDDLYEAANVPYLHTARAAGAVS